RGRLQILRQPAADRMFEKVSGSAQLLARVRQRQGLIAAEVAACQENQRVVRWVFGIAQELEMSTFWATTVKNNHIQILNLLSIFQPSGEDVRKRLHLERSRTSCFDTDLVSQVIGFKLRHKQKQPLPGLR